ncbi:secondary thiamine-phosphate synthase enzyme YjbQ [Paracoccus sp. 1_MG-2023]|uniref:secondary thiamine-phosphate synthase enzyme YjbQ n=1 Tax=unclassified Paracoccus (in: a-proteobacteria) TaxID=2688777 RepID=UPI001C08616D|nr:MULTISPECIES: secondary thiamine-phosphate synthase enzyme YjbQ [unclassified Paracoccus (in: a-proteobacteria)]MBU2957470.1 secondary thiamine-phosphate synthase enzyme YjbQ [Paracoccus sp. C2R09]MDO6669668.1 secondary thiamine-phosphate synthase enzyme YjbQ [Paracoccus sp. 1_MG-2023]
MIDSFEIQTNGPACYEFTREAAAFVKGQGDGLLTLMIRHTSASLLIQENADPEVQHDLIGWFRRLVPSSDDPSMRWLTHTYEGPDDMPAHIKSAMLPVSLQIPVQAGRMLLGRWQGIYVVEHRDRPHRRQVAALFQPLS